MRIPDGDLVPARRRAYGGGYGRRRRPLRRLAVVLVVLLAAAAAAWFLRRDESPAVLAAPCPTPSPTVAPAALPAPSQVRLVLLNGTTRNGLAKQVSTLLAARGFVVLTQDNAPRAVAGPSVITYGPGAEPAATVLARQVPGARLLSAPTARRGLLQLVLGGDYRRLATPAEVAAAHAASPQPVVGAASTQEPCRP